MVVAGFPGTAYPTVQADRNAVFVPLVNSVISVVLKRKVSFSCVGRSGEVRRGTLPPVEVIFTDSDVADEFRKEGSRLSKAKQEGVAHLYFNACVTLATRYVLTN